MKLTKEHLGKKMRRPHYGHLRYFIPLAITSAGTFIGESHLGVPENYIPTQSIFSPVEDWEEVEEYYKRGDKFLIDGQTYILAASPKIEDSDPYRYSLVCLDDGGHWSGFIKSRTFDTVFADDLKKHIGVTFKQIN